jgi:hypothetical protein
MLDRAEVNELIAEFAAMGFDPQDVLMAYLSSNQRRALVLDYLLAKTYSKNISYKMVVKKAKWT